MDDNVSSQDECGAVLQRADGTKTVVLSLSQAVDAMERMWNAAGPEVPLDLDSLFRYVDELREQKRTLFKERAVLQTVIGKLQKRVVLQEAEIERLQARVEEYESQNPDSV